MNSIQLGNLKSITNYKDAFIKLCMLLESKGIIDKKDVENLCSNDNLTVDDLFYELKMEVTRYG